jgi:hypothetical protein
MNLLAMMTLAVLVPSADTENADVWVRVSSNHVEILTSPEHAEAMRKKSGVGVLVQCKALKINYTAEGKVIECEGCTFYTSQGKNGKANSAVFDQVKGILTLTGDETTPVEWTTSSENGEQKIVSQSMQITLPSSENRPRRDDPRMFDEPRPLPYTRQATPQRSQVEDRTRNIPDPLLFEDGGREQLNPVKPPVRYEENSIDPVRKPPIQDSKDPVEKPLGDRA